MIKPPDPPRRDPPSDSLDLSRDAHRYDFMRPPPSPPPIPKAPGKRKSLLIPLLVVLVGIVYFFSSRDEEVKRAKVAAQADPAKHEALGKAIIEAEASGAFSNVSPGDRICTVSVGLPFYSTEFANKQRVAEIVYVWAFQSLGKEGAVVFLDRLSGKQVGTFSPATGLTME
jgi:hypothetical protein